MKKILFSLSLSLSIIYAIEFDDIINVSLENNININSLKIEIEKTTKDIKIINRIENPNIQMAISQDGYSLVVNQNIKLKSFTDKKEHISSLEIESKKVKINSVKSKLIKDISLAFNQYANIVRQIKLTKEVEIIQQKQYKISIVKYKSHFIKSQELLNDKLNIQEIKNKLINLNIQKEQAYLNLVQISEIIDLDAINIEYDFKLNKKLENSTNINIMYLNIIKKIKQLKGSLLYQDITSIDLFGEYEKDIEQDTYMIGINIPLNVYHQKEYEKTKIKLDIKSIQNRILNSQNILQNNEKSLLQQLDIYKSLKLNTKLIIDNLSDIISISKSKVLSEDYSIFEILSYKKKLLNLKIEIEQINTNINESIIKINYLRGNYYEY
jgi:hypothetical protein